MNKRQNNGLFQQLKKHQATKAASTGPAQRSPISEVLKEAATCGLAQLAKALKTEEMYDDTNDHLAITRRWCLLKLLQKWFPSEETSAAVKDVSISTTVRPPSHLRCAPSVAVVTIKSGARVACTTAIAPARAAYSWSTATCTNTSYE